MASTISTEARALLHAAVKDIVRTHTDAHDLAEAEGIAEEVRQIASQAALDASLAPLTGAATYEGARVPCKCGRKMKFVEYRERWVKSDLGECRISRAYYYCSGCRSGRHPWDERQGLNERIWSPRAKSITCQATGRLTYAEGTGLLASLGVLEIEESSAEDIVLEVGGRLRSYEQDQRKKVKNRSLQRLADRLQIEDVGGEPTPSIASRPVDGKRLYMATDATTAHIDDGWHNVQCGMVFTVGADAEGRDTLRERAYAAARTDMETFGWQLRTLAEEWGVSGYEERVFLGDGAPCNWNVATTHFPDAVQILDYYHLSEHLWGLGRALYRQEEAAEKARGDRWVGERLNSLKAAGARPLLRALRRRQNAANSDQREALRKMIGYVTNNAGRMDYPRYLAAGMMIGSGPVEAACKVIVCSRMKQSGMRWSDRGADAILAVRTTLLNNDTARIGHCARAA